MSVEEEIEGKFRTFIAGGKTREATVRTIPDLGGVSVTRLRKRQPFVPERPKKVQKTRDLILIEDDAIQFSRDISGGLIPDPNVTPPIRLPRQGVRTAAEDLNVKFERLIESGASQEVLNRELQRLSPDEQISLADEDERKKTKRPAPRNTAETLKKFGVSSDLADTVEDDLKVKQAKKSRIDDEKDTTGQFLLLPTPAINFAPETQDFQNQIEIGRILEEQAIKSELATPQPPPAQPFILQPSRLRLDFKPIITPKPEPKPEIKPEPRVPILATIPEPVPPTIPEEVFPPPLGMPPLEPPPLEIVATREFMPQRPFREARQTATALAGPGPARLFEPPQILRRGVVPAPSPEFAPIGDIPLPQTEFVTPEIDLLPIAPTRPLPGIPVFGTGPFEPRTQVPFEFQPSPMFPQTASITPALEFREVPDEKGLFQFSQDVQMQNVEAQFDDTTQIPKPLFSKPTRKPRARGRALRGGAVGEDIEREIDEVIAARRQLETGSLPLLPKERQRRIAELEERESELRNRDIERMLEARPSPGQRRTERPPFAIVESEEKLREQLDELVSELELSSPEEIRGVDLRLRRLLVKFRNRGLRVVGGKFRVLTGVLTGAAGILKSSLESQTIVRQMAEESKGLEAALGLAAGQTDEEKVQILVTSLDQENERLERAKREKNEDDARKAIQSLVSIGSLLQSTFAALRSGLRRQKKPMKTRLRFLRKGMKRPATKEVTIKSEQDALRKFLQDIQRREAPALFSEEEIIPQKEAFRGVKLSDPELRRAILQLTNETRLEPQLQTMGNLQLRFILDQLLKSTFTPVEPTSEISLEKTRRGSRRDTPRISTKGAGSRRFISGLVSQGAAPGSFRMGMAGGFSF